MDKREHKFLQRIVEVCFQKPEEVVIFNPRQRGRGFSTGV